MKPAILIAALALLCGCGAPSDHGEVTYKDTIKPTVPPAPGPSVDYSQSAPAIPEPTHQTKFGKLEAYYRATEFVKTKLVSPSTAEFTDGYERCTEQQNDTTFIIASYVDSQNSFGAMVRTRYVCQITYHPKTDSIFCTSLNLFENK